MSACHIRQFRLYTLPITTHQLYLCTLPTTTRQCYLRTLPHHPSLFLLTMPATHPPTCSFVR